MYVWGTFVFVGEIPDGAFHATADCQIEGLTVCGIREEAVHFVILLTVMQHLHEVADGTHDKTVTVWQYDLMPVTKGQKRQIIDEIRKETAVVTTITFYTRDIGDT